MSTIQNIRKSLVRDWKPVCSLVGDAVSGAEFAPFPSPLPPDSGGGWACMQLASSSLDCSVLPFFCKRPAVPLVLTLSNAARSFPFSPNLLVADASVWGTLLLGVAFRNLTCGLYLFFLLVRLPSEIQILPPDLPGERVSWCLETSSIRTPFPGWISVPNSFVSLFIFYILSYLLSKTMGCFSGCLMCSASNQKLFCGVCSVFK